MTDNVEQVEVEGAQYYRGVSALFATLAAALTSQPTQGVVEAVAAVAEALGGERACVSQPGPELEQRFYDRFVVSSARHFVPLTESCVTSRTMMDGKVRFGSYEGSKRDHVVRCYNAAGFKCSQIEGYAPVVALLKPDSMACMLSFMAALALSASGEEEGGPSARLLAEFAGRHCGWFADAAKCLAATDRDLYAQVAELATEAVAMVLAQE